MCTCVGIRPDTKVRPHFPQQVVVCCWLANGPFLFLGAGGLDAPCWSLVGGNCVPDHLMFEFVSVGGWLTYGDIPMDSGAQFLGVADHRLIPARARSICHQLRKAGYQSVWSLACQDQVCWGSCWGWGGQLWWCPSCFAHLGYP